MKTISSTSKSTYFINRYNNAKAQTLKECYKNPSYKKVRAFNSCALLYSRESGKGFKIISSGPYTFTVAWKVPEGLRVETVGNSYLVKF